MGKSQYKPIVAGAHRFFEAATCKNVFQWLMKEDREGESVQYQRHPTEIAVKTHITT